MRAALTIILLLLSSFSFATSMSRQCESTSEEKSIVFGHIKTQTFAGPPNYESIENGDMPETVKVIDLLSSICVVTSDPIDVIEIKAIQLLDQDSLLKGLADGKVMLTGQLFVAETGHHHTKVLLNVVAATNAL